MEVGQEYFVEWVDAGGILNFDKHDEIDIADQVATTRGRLNCYTELRGKRIAIFATTTYPGDQQSDLVFIPESLIVRIRRPTAFVDEAVP